MIAKNTTPIDLIIYGNYMKYTSMKNLTEKAFEGSDANEVNIYIDMYQIALELYRDARVENYSIVTSSMINLCAHIRGYYRSRHRVETKIFIVYSTNTSRSTTQFYQEYNKSYRERVAVNKLIDDMIKSNVDLLKTICPYLPDIYFISGTFEPGIIIYDIICKQELLGNHSPNIIFSKSVYNYQVPALRGDTVIFRNKKSKDNDATERCRLVTNQNVLYEYITETRPTVNYVNRIGDLSGELLSLVIALTNMPSRNITTLFNIASAFNMIYDAIRNGRIINAYNSDIHYVYEQLNSIKPFPVDITTFSNRFKCVDLRYQLMIYMDSAESKDNSYLLDLYDNNTVKAINNEYFKTNPLDLNRL